jgi:ABC-2 type transport system permease protein
MWAMVMKEFQELRRDRRTMAMLIVLPLLLLVVFGYAAGFNVSSIPTDVYGPQAQQVADALKDPFEVRTVDSSGSRHDAETALRDNKADVGIVTQSSGTRTPSAGSAASAASASTGSLSSAAATSTTSSRPTPSITTSTGPTARSGSGRCSAS